MEHWSTKLPQMSNPGEIGVVLWKGKMNSVTSQNSMYFVGTHYRPKIGILQLITVTAGMHSGGDKLDGDVYHV